MSNDQTSTGSSEVNKTESVDTSSQSNSSSSGLQTNSKSRKGLYFGIGTLGVLLILLVVSLFVRFGNQTVFARTMDAVGQHQSAIAFDSIATSGFNSFSGINNIDLSKPESCAELISLTNFKNLDAAAISSSFYAEVKPVNSAYQDKYGYTGFVDSAISVKDVTARMYLDQMLKLDLDQIYSLSGTDSTTKLGVTTLKLKADGIVAGKDAAYLNLMNLGITTKGFNSQNNLVGWYKQDLKQSDKSKEGIQDIANIISNLLLTKPNQVFNDDNLKSIASLYCESIQKVDFQAPKNVEFGTGEYKVSREVRPLVITMKTDAQKIYQAKLPALLEKLSKDDKLRTFLKSKYDDYVKLLVASDKINSESKASDSKLNKADFDKEVDKMLDAVKKDDIAENLKSSLTNTSTVSENFTLSNQTSEMYLDMATMLPYGSSSNFTVVPTAGFLQTLQDPKMQELIKDGIFIKVQSFSSKAGSSASKISIPSDTKSFDSFTSDVQNTPAAQQIQKVVPSTSSSNSAGSDRMTNEEMQRMIEEQGGAPTRRSSSSVSTN